MLRWFCHFGIRVLWWSARASSGMGDGAAGSRVTVRVSVSVNVSFLLDMP